MQQRAQRFVDQEAQRHVQQPLAQCERHVEHHQAVQQRVGGRHLRHRPQDLLIHPHNGLQRQAVQHHIGGIDDEIVDGYADDRHGGGPGHGAPQRPAPVLVLLVDDTRNKREHRAQQEIGQLAHTGAGAEGQVQQVLHQLDGDAVDGAEGERAQQGGQVGDVQLDKGGHDGDGELHELEDGGHRRQQGSHRDTMGLLLLSHKKTLLLDDKHPENCLPRCTHQKRASQNAIHAFSHPDYTVGTGITPVQPCFHGSRTIPPVGNHTPPRRIILKFLFIITHYNSAYKYIF